MAITTKGHIEHINNDKITTSSWDGRWDEEQGAGSIATINTNKIGSDPENVVEDYKPIADVNQLNPYMNNDPRMDQYFALRTIPRKPVEPAQEVHDDTYTPKKTPSALMDKLELLLENEPPKVLVFKPQAPPPLTPSSASPTSIREEPRASSHYSTPKRKSVKVQTRKKKKKKKPPTPKKKKPPTPKKKKTPTPKKKKTFTPPTYKLKT